MSLLISGCASDYAALVTYATPWGGEYSGDWLDKYRNQQIKWNNCSSDFFAPSDQISQDFEKAEAKCAYLKVPVLYNEKNNPGDLEIAVIKDSADTNKMIGTVFTNPGGPGGSGVDMIQWGVFPQEVEDVYDIIGFDPRGVARSSPIKCDSATALSAYFNMYFDPKSTIESQINANFETSYYENCLKNNKYWYAMNTGNVVQDLDILRAAITPDKKLNFVGHSYGTAIGARYITEFPKKSGLIILDSPVVDELGGSGWDAQGESFKIARNLLFKKCALDKNCPGKTVTDVENFFISARDAILDGKLQGYVASTKDSSFFTTKSKGSPELLLNAVRSLSYLDIDSAYRSFLPAYKEMISGDYSTFEKIGLDYVGFDVDTLMNDNSYDTLELVNCLDTDLSSYELVESTDAFEKNFYNPFVKEVEYFGYQGCFWSIKSTDDSRISDPPATTPAYENKTKKTFLVIGTKFDNATPFDWAVSVSQTLRSTLITYEGTGHANLWNGTVCIDNPAIEYLLSGDLPSSDLICQANSP